MPRSSNWKYNLLQEFTLIADHNNVTVYSRVHSTKCWCKDKANQETMIVKICKKTNTISYSCKHCLNSTLKLVNHIYVYPTKNEPMVVLYNENQTTKNGGKFLRCTKCSKLIITYGSNHQHHC